MYHLTTAKVRNGLHFTHLLLLELLELLELVLVELQGQRLESKSTHTQVKIAQNKHFRVE